MGYIFATFNKLTYMLIIHVCVYIHIFVFVTKIMGIPWNTWAYPWRRPCTNTSQKLLQTKTGILQ